MRHALAGMLVALVPLAAVSQPVDYKFAKPVVTKPSGIDGSRMAELLRHQRPASRIVPEVAHESGDNAFIFPLIGNTPGANGTFFRSEATLLNNGSNSQRMRLFFFPAGAQTCNGIPIRDIEIPAYNWYEYGDIIADVFGMNGLGSLGVIPIDAFGNFDSTAHIDATIRIFTSSSGGGSVSQTFDSIALSNYGGNEVVFGLRSDSGFRTNYGIFNYLGYSRTFDAYFYGLNNVRAQASVTVGPCSVAFSAVPNLNYGALLINVIPRDSDGGWYGFASSVDNTSGDSWSVSARP